MAIDSTALQGWLLTHAAATVEIAPNPLGYEPKGKINYAGSNNRPVLACWWMRTRPTITHSAMNKTSARTRWAVRLHLNAFPDDQAAVERNLLTAQDALIASFFGNFVAAPDSSFFDPKGMDDGEAFTSDGGFVEIDRQLSRQATIVLDIVTPGAWSESP